jgi:hypothetical protein
MNPAEQVLRRVDRCQQQHLWVGVPFAVVKKFGDDKGGNLTTYARPAIVRGEDATGCASQVRRVVAHLVEAA